MPEMLLRLWNYLRGYVMIQVSGFSVERFLSMAAYRGVYLWNICHGGSGLNCCVGRRDLEKLAPFAEKTGCTVTIAEQRGVPFLFERYQKRKILGAGVLVFVAMLYVLSSFVWTMEVTGNDRLKTADILAACDAEGLAPGVWKRTVDTREVGEHLLLRFSDISWVAVTIQGTHAKINVVETILKPEIVDRVTPTDLVAGKAGVIVSMAASAGTPMAKAGDVVEAGQLLVSSEVRLMVMEEEVGREYVHAAGEVTARVWYHLEDSLPLNYTEKNYTGEQKTHKSLILGDTVVDFLRPDVDASAWDWEILTETPLKIGDYHFPVALRSELARAYVLEEKSRTEEEARQILSAQLKTELEAELPDAAVLEDEEITFVREGDRLIAQATYTVLERIEQEKTPIIGSDEVSDGENPTD